MNHLKSFEVRRNLFLDSATQKFGDQYSYEKFEYVNARTKSVIVCKDHGEFEQNPDKHLRSTYACPDCLSAHRVLDRKLNPRAGYKPTLSPEAYLEKLGLPDQYTVDLSEYAGLTIGTVTLHCLEHGDTRYIPQALLQSKHKCRRCAFDHIRVATTGSFEDFTRDASSRYAGYYQYPEQEFENRKSMVTIICPDHGEFEKRAEKHLQGQGCYPCTLLKGISEGKYPGGYSRKVLTENPDLAAEAATLYYFKVGDLYKVGITARPLNLRVKSVKSSSRKSVEVLQQHSCTLLEAYELEQHIIDEFKEYRVYRPWSTELFKEDILKDRKLEEFD
jgi:hypothetical protein